MILRSFRPGQVWMDTSGRPIQAHGGSLITVGDDFYWYGENKEYTTADGSIWHWGVRAYRSRDLYNWEDCGLIIEPEPDDPESPLHPHNCMDRPHIVFNAETGLYVCWIKVMTDRGQRSSVLTSTDFLGPWTFAHQDFKPLGMNAGDFDLVIDPTDAKGYYYFERVHSELICADLTDDYTDVTGYYSTHFPRLQPPFVREAPAYFERGGLHYLVTSGTTGYYPNPSEVAVADTYHGPWTVLGDPHPGDPSRTSFHSQISSVFKHPGKKDLYIAMADRWLPHYMESSDAAIRMHAERFRPMGGHATGPVQDLTHVDTAKATYVWLPFRFDDGLPLLDWKDEWRIEDYEDVD
ncbi:family 43 glycosylhydrolase [Schaalia vaccimaxillae]|uniref:family 43 glycosylhydrolase n=1 Tax=Schaalia vaccimaxillae TaxID=183916 RepID=UPI0003B2F157|nr:family 43 glycosylhydrolase [Schaalia vaccimaxillae]